MPKTRSGCFCDYISTEEECKKCPAAQECGIGTELTEAGIAW